MRSSKCLGGMVMAAVLLVGASTVNAGAIDFGASSWDATQVVLRITGVPEGTRVTVCVFNDAGCEIKGSVRSAPAGADGLVNVIVPVSVGAYAIGDTVRVSDPDCGILEEGGTIGPQDCGDVCPECEITPIPTVSEWGLAVMTLLVIGAGTIVFRRFRAVAA